ncbi:MAG: YtxH domain-containing protein [Peptostreptococcaceae bacterium]
MSLLQKIESARIRKIKEDRNKKLAIATAGVATGALVGTVVGVLVAPASGKETIQVTKNKVNENLESTKNKVNESKTKIKEYLDKVRNERIEKEIVEEEVLMLPNSMEESIEV